MRTAKIPVTAGIYHGLAGANPSQQQIDKIFKTMESEDDPPQADLSVYQYKETTIDLKMTFPAYTISFFAFWGHVLLVVFMGTGLISVPFGFVTSWADRPRPMLEKEFQTAKSKLAKQVEELLKAGRKLYDNKLKFDGDKAETNFFGGLKMMGRQRGLNKEQHEFEVNCILTEKQFQKLQMTAQYRNKVEPMKYTGFLIAGFLSGIAAVLFHI